MDLPTTPSPTPEAPPPAVPTPTPSPTPNPEPKPEPKSESDSEAKQLKDRLAKIEARNAELEKAELERAEAQLSEIDKAKKRAASAEEKAASLVAKLKEKSLNSAFREAAAAAGCQDTSLALLALDRSAVTVDDEGNVSGLESAMKAIQKSHPLLFNSSRPASGGTGNPPGGPPVRNSYTAADIKKMSKADFAKFDRQVRSGSIRLS